MTTGKKSANSPTTAGKRPPRTAWKKGESGNPAGKPKGTRNRMTNLAIAVLEKDVEAIAGVVTAAALGGDLQAARLVIERLVPPIRERGVSLVLPPIDALEGVSAAQQAILDAVCAGDLLPGEGTTLSGIVEQRRKAIESQELEQRIAALEGKTK